MSIILLNANESVTNITPISHVKDCVVDLVTIHKEQTPLSPLTRMLLELPYKVRKHSKRSAIVAKILAEKIFHLSGNIDISSFSYTIWLGGLYHHIDKQVLHELLPEENVDGADKNMIVQIVQEASGCSIESSLEARLVSFGCLLDRLFVDSEFNFTSNIIQEKWTSVFGSDLMDCFIEEQEQIFKLYGK